MIGVSLKNALSNSSVDQITVKGNLSSNDQLKTNGTGAAVATNAGAVVLANAQAKATTNISNGHKVTLVGADDSAALSVAKNMQAITLSGSNWDITFKNLKINTDNQVGILDLSQTNGKQKVTFDNVRSNDSALYNGGGDTDVYIYGDTTSNVSTTTLAVANQQGFGGQYDSNYYDANGAINNNRRVAANIHAANVIITDGAKLTLTRSVDGDGIVGYDGLQMANTNDPTDPTKVVPNEPVPAITGKTPDKTSVTPTDPTKDTPVVYKDNEVPATSNPQKAVVNFVDINTGKLIKTSGILSGRPGEDINKLY